MITFASSQERETKDSDRFTTHQLEQYEKNIPKKHYLRRMKNAFRK